MSLVLLLKYNMNLGVLCAATNIHCDINVIYIILPIYAPKIGAIFQPNHRVKFKRVHPESDDKTQ